MKASILIAILLVCTPVAVVADDEQPSADAPAVDASAAELEAARQQVAELNEQAKASATELAEYKQKLEVSNQALEDSNKKVESLTKELTDSKASVSKYREQADELKTSLEAAQKELEDAKHHKAKAAGAAEDLAAAKQELESKASEMAATQKQAAELKLLLEAPDVQAYLQVRKLTSETAEIAAQHTSEALDVASQYTDQASKVVAENYEQAWQQAEELAAEATPHVEDFHNQFMKQATPLAAQMTATATETFEQTVGMIKEQMDAFEPAKPYAEQGSWWITVSIVGLPILLLAFLCFKVMVLFTSKLLHKLQYVGVCFMVGGVLTTHALAHATESDPIEKLHAQQPALDAQAHWVLAVIATALVFLHFVTLVAKDNGGKSVKAQFASMIAAVLVVVVFCHYYFLVYLKRNEPGFKIILPYSTAGDPSYTEYSIFLLALTLFTALGLPAGFRCTARALYIALESGIAGALGALILFNNVDPQAFSHTLALQEYFTVFWGLAGLLVLVLAYRSCKKLGKGVLQGMFAFVHLLMISRVLFVVYQMTVSREMQSTTNLKFAMAGLLFVSVVHTFWVTFGAEGETTGKGSASSPKRNTKAGDKNQPSGKKKK